MEFFCGIDGAFWLQNRCSRNLALGDSMSGRMTLPVLPLRDAVLFPGVATPIGAGRPATLRAIEAALKDPDRKVFAVAQKDNVDQVSPGDRKSTRLNSSHGYISYAVFCLKKK